VIVSPCTPIFLGGCHLKALKQIKYWGINLGRLFHIVNTHVHDVSGLEYALLIIPVCQLIAGLLAFFQAKDYKRHQGLFPSILSA
jgi:hypothetical protein